MRRLPMFANNEAHEATTRWRTRAGRRQNPTSWWRRRARRSPGHRGESRLIAVADGTAVPIGPHWKAQPVAEVVTARVVT